MSETDPEPLPTSKMELAVAINGSPTYAKSPVLARRHAFIIYHPHYWYSIKSKPGKVCTRNSIDSFLYLFVLLYLR